MGIKYVYVYTNTHFVWKKTRTNTHTHARIHTHPHAHTRTRTLLVWREAARHTHSHAPIDNAVFIAVASHTRKHAHTHTHKQTHTHKPEWAAVARSQSSSPEPSCAPRHSRKSARYSINHIIWLQKYTWRTLTTEYRNTVREQSRTVFYVLGLYFYSQSWVLSNCSWTVFLQSHSRLESAPRHSPRTPCYSVNHAQSWL